MYIRHLEVDNLKRLGRFELDFTHRGEPRMWTVLIGENGTAKTTLLQAIALAAAGYKEVSGLAGATVKHLCDRRKEESMVIDVQFMFGPNSAAGGEKIHPLMPPKAKHKSGGLELRSRVSLPFGTTSLDAEAHYGGESSKPVARDPLAEARATNAPLWFVAGYGISRALPDANETPTLTRPSIERLEPLFRQKQLASIGFANHFLEKDQRENRKLGETSRRFSRMLNQAIKLGGADLFESDRFYQVMARKQDPVAIAGVALSHGYQSTFAWIADLIGHVLLESKTELDTTDMEGLVLIDEIDLYLHPTWQARFIPALRRVFPRLQFVATTHSPVVLSSLAPHEVVRLVVDEETGDIVQGLGSPGWTVPSGRSRRRASARSAAHDWRGAVPDVVRTRRHDAQSSGGKAPAAPGPLGPPRSDSCSVPGAEGAARRGAERTHSAARESRGHESL